MGRTALGASPRSDLILAGASTEKGLRDENQDAMTSFACSFGSVYLVADGMGGLQGGATASLMTAECYRKYLTSLSADLPVEEALQRATAATNAEIRLRSQSGDPAIAGMGSTVVMLVFAPSSVGLHGTVGHIGDSRAYLLRRGELHRLTRDHSAVQRMIDSNQITAEEARHHPGSSVITRALGPHDEVVLETGENSFEPGDVVLLCSDGLCGFVDDDAIAGELAQTREAAATAAALIALALRSGSSDNITVQVLRVAAPGAIEREPGPGKAASPQAGSEPASRVRARRGWNALPRLARYGVLVLLGLVLGLMLAALLGHRVHWGEGLHGRTVRPKVVKPAPAVRAPPGT